jgi:uncharacterized membrane protein (UPF0182 family)
MKNKWLKILTGITIGIFFIFFVFSGVVTDFLWFSSLGFEKIFLINVGTFLGVFFPVFIATIILMLWYGRLLLSKYQKYGKVNLSIKEISIVKKIINWSGILIGLYVGITFASSSWYKILEYINQTPFGILDPLFSKDISFYFFTFPLINTVLSLFITLAVILIVTTIAFYSVMIKEYPPEDGVLFDINEITLKPNLKSIFRKDLSRYVIRKVTYFSTAFLLILGGILYLKTFSLLYSPLGVIYGAGFTDKNVYILGYRILSVISIIGGLVLPFIVNKRSFKISLVIPTLLVATFLLMNIAGFIVQQAVVEPNEFTMEKEFINYNIDFTRQGFGVNDVKILDFKVDNTLDSDIIENNKNLIDNIRINDERPLLQTFNQIQVLRLYYMFNDVDIDRYVFNDEYKQVLISAREMKPENLVESAQTWINTHIKYTHGYGLVLSAVNDVTNEGQPELLIKNVPSTVEGIDIEVNQPEIYFGELTNQYIIINTKENEFNYPSGSDNEETRYEGTDGIKLSLMNKLLFAIREKSMKMLLSTNLKSDSKIIIYRNILQRANKLLPFVEFDTNPYLVLSKEDGRLYWIIDGYTTSNMYPYSQVYNFNSKKVNYVRNSVKAVVDAYNGTIDFYKFDEEDPLINTYDNMYPDLLKDVADMPKEMMAHVKYPQSLFGLQSEVLKAYHVINPNVFYNGEDFWDIANEKFISEVSQIEPNYIMLKLPESNDVEFVNTIPFTPKQKANMTSLFVARNDGENYGEKLIYTFPKDKTVDGPMMIESRIDQDSTISPQFTLWSQEGSQVIRGNLVTVPIDNSLLYVEPVYIQATNENSIPELKRVIVVYKDNIVMENDLKTAFNKIFGELPNEQVIEKPSNNDTNSDNDTVETQIIEAYEKLKIELENLEKLIMQLKK